MTSERGSFPPGRILLAIALTGFLLEAPPAATQSVEHREPELVAAALTLVDAGDRATAIVDRIDQVWLVKKLGLARRARDSFRRAVELDPAWMEARISMLGFYLEAPKVAGGSSEKAAEQAEAIAELDRARGNYARAAIWEKKERYDLEAAELRGAVQLDPDNLEYHGALGRLYQRLERWDEAHEVFEAALRVDPRHGPSLYRLGRGAAHSGTHLERGAQALRAYLELEHADEAYLPWVHYQLGVIHGHRQDPEAARQAFAEALRLDPDLEQAREALASLDADR